MSRKDYRYESTTFSGGINQEADEALPEECEDALNVWRPGSRLEGRPGYRGVGSVQGGTDGADIKAVKEVNGVFTTCDAAGVLDVEDLVKDRDRLYVGHTVANDGVIITVTTANAANTIVKSEYWNGAEWMLLAVEMNFMDGGAYFLGVVEPVYMTYARPQDWIASAVNGVTRYWIRFCIQGNSIVGAGGNCTIDASPGSITIPANVRGLAVTQYPGTKRYHAVVLTSGMILFAAGEAITGRNVATADMFPYIRGRGLNNNEPACTAVVPQFDESFTAYDYKVVKWRARPVTGDSAATAIATVEGRDFAVGQAAPYDARFVAMLGEFPPCKYITFFAGRLWVAGLLNEPYTIRWSAAAPFHRVWTALAFEYLMEADNSPITGMAPLGEHMIVFKQDSIWAMIPVGANPATGVESYTPKQVVTGIGCVSNASIKQVRGELVFLSEQGIYAFNGTPAIRKVTERGPGGPDRLRITMASISKPKRSSAAAAHWKSQGCYLLSFSTRGGANDTTVVWEYGRDRWWVWDNIEAQHWLEDEGVGDDECLYFGDSAGRIYRFGVGRTDHGAAITGHIKTHRFGYYGQEQRGLRAVRLVTTNDTRSLAVEVSGDEHVFGTAVPATIDISEHDWDDFCFPDPPDDTSNNWVERKRRLVRSDVEANGEWHQVKITHDTKYQPFCLSRVALGFNTYGVR